MSKPMEEMRQIALRYERNAAQHLTPDEFSLPPTNKVMVNVNTLFAALEDYDIMCKIVFALDRVTKELRCSLNASNDDQQ